MDWGLAAAFWVVSMLFVITPGADWAYAITVGLAHRNAAPAVIGLLAGHVAATLAVAAGAAAVMAGTPVLLTGLTVAGAAYLVWLGATTLRHPATPHFPDAEQPEMSARAQFLKGLGVSGLNPKVFLLFLALLPQFTDAGAAWPVTVQIVVLGLVHVANCGVVYAVVSTGARVVLRARPAAARLVSRFAGAAMVGIGSVLLIESFAH